MEPGAPHPIEVQRDIAQRAYCPLCVRESSAPNANFVVYAGFVVDVGERWLWFTAAHCLDEISERAWDSAEYHFRTPNLGTGVVFVRFRSRDVVNVRDIVSRCIQEESRRFDFDVAYVVLSPFDAAQLAAEGTVPLSWEHVLERRNESVADEYALFAYGSPVEGYTASGFPIQSIRVELVDLDELSTANGGEPLDATPPRAVFKFSRSDAGIERSIKGVSGGPLILASPDRFWLIGIVTAELRGNPHYVIAHQTRELFKLVASIHCDE